MSGTADLLATKRMFVSGRVGYAMSDLHTDNVRSTPRFYFPYSNVALLDVPSTLQRVTGFMTDANTYDYGKHFMSRLTARIDATWYLRGAGEHALKAGLQADWNTNELDEGYKANTVSLYWNRTLAGTRGAYGYHLVGSNDVQPRRGQVAVGKGSGRTFGLFVQDAWRVTSRLTVDAGVRTERELGRGTSPAAPATTGWWSSGSATSSRRAWAPPTICWTTDAGRCTAAGACSSTR